MGRVYSWGCNDDKALGRQGNEKTPLLVEAVTTPMNNICAGNSFSVCYNTELNQVYTWGVFRDSNNNIRSPWEPEQVDPKMLDNLQVMKVVCGANHILALAGNTVYTWGNNESYQIGKYFNPDRKSLRSKIRNEDPVEEYKKQCLRPARLLLKNVLNVFAAGDSSYLIQQEKGGKQSVKGFGRNNLGQLGLGHWENQWVPQDIKFFKDKEHIKQIVGGSNHTLFLLENREVFACGKNDEGQCGVLNPEGSERFFMTPQKVGYICPSAQDPNVMDNKDLTVDEIFANGDYCYSLSKENLVYSWGMGDSYVLGNKREENKPTPYLIPSQFFNNLTVNQVLKYFILFQ